MISRNSQPSSPTRRDLLRAAVACGVATALPVGLAGPATADPSPVITDTSLAGLYIGADGRFHRADLGSAGPLNATVIGPPGGNLSTVRLTNGSVLVFTIDNRGALLVGHIGSSGAGMALGQPTQGGVAPPGGTVAAVEGPTGVHVYFFGNNGLINQAMYSKAGWLTMAPVPLPQAGYVLPAAPLATFRVSDRFGVVYVGTNGGVYTTVGRMVQGPAGPIPIHTTTLATQANMAPPNAPVTVASGANQVAAFFTDTDGRLWRIPFAFDTPRPAVALSGPGAVPVGAYLAATIASTGELAVAYAGADGAIRAFTDAFGPRTDPWVITPPGVHVPGNPLAVTYDGDYLYVGWCGVDLWLWLLWWWRRRPFPPPPPGPDPYHELREIVSPVDTLQNFNVGVTLTGS